MGNNRVKPPFIDMSQLISSILRHIPSYTVRSSRPTVLNSQFRLYGVNQIYTIEVLKLNVTTSIALRGDDYNTDDGLAKRVSLRMLAIKPTQKQSRLTSLVLCEAACFRK